MSRSEFCGTSLAARKLGLSVTTIQTLVEKKMLKAWKTDGGHRRISLESVAEYQKCAGEANINAKDKTSSLKVLIVDESSATYDLLQKISPYAGILLDCVWVDSAFKALMKLRSAQPDILIADISTSNQDAYELLQSLGASHSANALRLLGLTSAAPSAQINTDKLSTKTVLVKKPVQEQWLLGYLAAQIALLGMQTG